MKEGGGENGAKGGGGGVLPNMEKFIIAANGRLVGRYVQGGRMGVGEGKGRRKRESGEEELEERN